MLSTRDILCLMIYVVAAVLLSPMDRYGFDREVFVRVRLSYSALYNSEKVNSVTDSVQGELLNSPPKFLR